MEANLRAIYKGMGLRVRGLCPCLIKGPGDQLGQARTGFTNPQKWWVPIKYISANRIINNCLHFFVISRQHRSISVQRIASLEFCWLHAQLHDRLQSPLRRVDRVHVGLHGRRLESLRSVLPCNSRHWKSCRECFFAYLWKNFNNFTLALLVCLVIFQYSLEILLQGLFSVLMNKL